MRRFGWALWIAGMVLVGLNWIHAVSNTWGWVGFGCAVTGWAAWRLGRPPDEPGEIA